MLPKNKGPCLAGPHVTEQQKRLHSSSSTSKLVQVKKKSLCTVAVHRALDPMGKHSCLLCSLLKWIAPINVLVILPSWQVLMNAAIGSLFESLALHLWISVYQHLQKRPCVLTEKLSASCTIYITLKRSLLLLTIHRYKHAFHSVHSFSSLKLWLDTFMYTVFLTCDTLIVHFTSNPACAKEKERSAFNMNKNRHHQICKTALLQKKRG